MKLTSESDSPCCQHGSMSCTRTKVTMHNPPGSTVFKVVQDKHWQDHRSTGSAHTNRLWPPKSQIAGEAAPKGAPGVELPLQTLHVDQEVDDVLVRVVRPCTSARCKKECGLKPYSLIYNRAWRADAQTSAMNLTACRQDAEQCSTGFTEDRISNDTAVSMRDDSPCTSAI